MKSKKQFVLCVLAVSCLSSASSSSGAPFLQASNEMKISLAGVSDLIIAYDEENITFYESKNDDLIIKEYMTDNKSGYYAKIDRYGSGIRISEGRKPFFKDGFSRSVEVYLPISYRDTLTVATTTGTIDFSRVAVSISTLRIASTAGVIRLNEARATNINISSTSGPLDLGSLEARRIRIETTSGAVLCHQLKGEITYISTSGGVTISSAAGSGSYTMGNSGILNVSYTVVTGDLSFFNKNGDINVTIPSDLEFKFIASARNGSVSTNFKNYITLAEKKATGSIGSHPVITITAETNNGDISFVR